MTMERKKELASSAEFQLRQGNFEALMNIIPKIKFFLNFIENSSYLQKTRHSELGYAKKDWPQIENLFKDTMDLLNKLDEEKRIAFHHENSLDHIIGNYALMAQGNVEGKMKKNISVGIPMTPEVREKMRDLGEPDFQFFTRFKAEWDLIVYYLELVKKNPDILEAEINSKEGWLGEYKDFFHGQKIPTMDVKDQLEYINFFARLRNFPSELGGVRGLKNLVIPISEENFEAEFNRLLKKDDKKELLDKESVRRHFLEEPEHQQAA